MEEQITVRVPRTLKVALERVAESEIRSLGFVVRRALEAELERSEIRESAA